VNARRIANQSADYGNLAIGGGYSFAYAIALFAVYLFDRLRNKAITNYKERIFCIYYSLLLKCGVDWKIGYSPERINPGDKEHRLETIMKIVSGMDEESLDIIAKVYELVVDAGVYRAE